MNEEEARKILPIQPLYRDKSGVIRFSQNRIVDMLLDKGPFDLNQIAIMVADGEFTKEEFVQLDQLIGYSLYGFSDLSYVDDETFEAAEKMALQGKSELEARNEHLREVLDNAREGVRNAATSLFKIHPDDLET